MLGHPRASVAAIDTFVTLALFSGFGLLLSLTVVTSPRQIWLTRLRSMEWGEIPMRLLGGAIVLLGIMAVDAAVVAKPVQDLRKSGLARVPDRPPSF